MCGSGFSVKLHNLIANDRCSEDLMVFTAVAEQKAYLTTYSSGDDIFENFSSDKVEKLIGVLKILEDKSIHAILMSLIQKKDVQLSSTDSEKLVLSGLVEIDDGDIKITQKGTLFYLSLYSTTYHLQRRWIILGIYFLLRLLLGITTQAQFCANDCW